MEKLKIAREDFVLRKGVANLMDVESLTIQGLIDYLQECHRHFFQYHIPKIEEAFLQYMKVNTSHEVKLLFGLFINYQVELSHHILTEEKEVFPLITEVSENYKLSQVTSAWSGLIEVQKAIDSHVNSEIYLSELINGLKHLGKVHPPFSLRVLINRIQLFQELLEEHAEIEDYILPKKINEFIGEA